MQTKNEEFCSAQSTNSDTDFYVHVQFYVRTRAQIKTLPNTDTQSELCAADKYETVQTNITEINPRLGIEYKMTCPSLEAEWSNFLSEQSMQVVLRSQCQFAKKVEVHPEARLLMSSSNKSSDMDDTMVHLEERYGIMSHSTQYCHLWPLYALLTLMLYMELCFIF